MCVWGGGGGGRRGEGAWVVVVEGGYNMHVFQFTVSSVVHATVIVEGINKIRALILPE